MNWLTVLRSRWFVLLAIPLLWALAYLPQLQARDLRLEEGRRATPAAEMLATGNFITPTLYGERYLSKPPGFFWIVVGMGHFGASAHVTELSVRIPSVLSVLVGAYLLIQLGKRGKMPREVQVLAALIFMSLPIMLDKGTLGEIDAVLSYVTFAALVVLWQGYNPESGRVSWWAWTPAGILLALSILLKGPGGVAEFYAVLVAFCIFARRWRVLFSLGHLWMLVLALLPVTIWITLLLRDTGMAWKDLAGIWSTQTGVDVLTGSGQGKGWTSRLVDHYLWFPIRVFTMLLPWSVFAIVGSFPSTGRQLPVTDRRSRDAWIFLAVAGPALLLVFWLWPKANPRYMMMVAYPVAALTALVIANARDMQSWPTLPAFLKTAGIGMGFGIIGIAVTSVILALKLHPPAIPVACAVAAVCTALAIPAIRWTVRTPSEPRPAAIACACNLALLILLGRGMIAGAVLMPYLAKKDATRIYHEQANRIIPPGVPVYTTRTFGGNRDERYFNPQFYLTPGGGGLKALADFETLRKEPRAIAIITPDEWPKLQAVFPHAVQLGKLHAPKGPPEVIVAEVTRPAAPQ